MGWIIKFNSFSEKQLKKLDRNTQKNILNFLEDKIKSSSNPKYIGHSLTGKLSGLWRYRVGDHRIICEIKNNELAILVIGMGHRKDIYEKFKA